MRRPASCARDLAARERALSASHSETPLLKKLGYAAGQRACLIAVPVAELLAFANFAERRLLKDLNQFRREKGPFDLVHLFIMAAAGLPVALAQARDRRVPDGMIWVSWPKKTAGIATDVSDQVVRRHAIAAGLADVKVCAVDATWSGLKLVIPKAMRR
jgi:hypothetical protein